MKSSVILPSPGQLDSTDEYGRQQWRKVQRLADLFWKRWRLEYLSTLQPRQRWKTPVPNLQVGDIVVLKDENQLRGEWKLARITKIMPSTEKMVQKMELIMGENQLNDQGKRLREASVIARPVHKLKVILRSKEF